MIVVGLFLGIMLGLLAYCVRMLIRNERVFDFREELRQLTFYNGENWQRKIRIYDKYSYADMLHSHKPLKLESFFTEEEIKILTDQN